MNALPPIAWMQTIVSRRDSDFDGVFFVGVRTTGIFCRPSCPARPLPRNRVFLATIGEALAAGYRPCRRCRPLEVGGRLPEWMTPLLERIAAEPGRRWPDKELRAAGMDPVQVRRAFLRHFGTTFQAYCRDRRLGQAFQRIQRGASLDEVALESGYDSLSGFRHAFEQAFGEPPGRASRPPVVVSWLESPLCPLLLAADDEGIRALRFLNRGDLERQLKELRSSLGGAVVPGANRHVERAERELGQYFGDSRTSFDVPLRPTGTPFQRAVWDRLQEIPYGETWSYAMLARKVRRSPAACRAVGQANGRNPIAILIPCHRVINQDGTLGGYGGELWRKRYLLALEQRVRRGENLDTLTDESSPAGNTPLHG